MNITQVKIYPLTDSKTLALASITLDNEFVVSGLKVMSGQNGLWVAFPSRKNKEGTVDKHGQPKPYSDICYPITAEARQGIITTVLDKYNEQVEPHEIYENVSESFKKQENEPTIDVASSDLPF